MKFKKSYKTIFYQISFFTVFIYFVLICCNSVDNTQKDLPKAKITKKETKIKLIIKHIGIAYALGGKGDMSYNDAANKGVELLKFRGIEVKEFEPNSLDDYAKGLELLSLNNLDLIFCVGYLYDHPVKRISSTFTNTIYVVLDGSAAKHPNVASLKFNAKEGSFLAGAIASKLTKSQKIAFIGGTDIPIINEFRDGFVSGVKAFNKTAVVHSYYIGTGGAAFTDPVKGREAALSAISNGADVIFHAAGSSGNGVIKACKERSIPVIGVDVDQSHLAPEVVITSMIKNFDTVMTYIVDRLNEGDSIAGKNFLLGIKESAVSLVPIKGAYKKEIDNVIQEAKKMLLSKTLDQN